MLVATIPAGKTNSSLNHSLQTWLYSKNYPEQPANQRRTFIDTVNPVSYFAWNISDWKALTKIVEDSRLKEKNFPDLKGCLLDYCGYPHSPRWYHARPTEDTTKISGYSDVFAITVSFNNKKGIRIDYKVLHRHRGELLWNNNHEKYVLPTIESKHYENFVKLIEPDNYEIGISTECPKLWIGMVYLIDEGVIERSTFIEKVRPWIEQEGNAKVRTSSSLED